MIKLSGRLTVTTRKSARGEFSVGDLTTPIGQFKIKDTILEQFEAGTYDGEFIISKIFLSQYVWQGRACTELRASIDEVIIDAEEKGNAPGVEQSEPDPIIQEQAAPIPAAPEIAPEKREEQTLSNAPGSLKVAVEILGDELGAQAHRELPVKLDPTIDRTQFRAQRDYLKGLGYSFDSKGQVWVLVKE